MNARLWTLREYPFHPEKLRHYETIFTIGNGYLGTRGSMDEGYEGSTPSTLVHGIYNHAPNTQVSELVNAPNWTAMQIRVDGTPVRLITHSSDLINPPDGLILGYERTLHMNDGLLRRAVLFRAASGATVRIVFERFASMADRQVLAQRVQITAVDGDPVIELEAILDGQVSNHGAQHWATMTPSAQAERFSLVGVTNQSAYELAMCAVLIGSGTPTGQTQERRASASLSLQLKPQDQVIFDKLVAVCTSRDSADPAASAAAKLAEARAIGYEQLLEAHRQAWARCWQAMDIIIEGDEFAQLGVRFTTYHLLIAAPQHDDQVSIGAKTLSGLGYKGHVFWDTELFMLPPFTLTLPQAARNMLMYRYHRLAGARQKARENGYEGAMFPWESTDTGLETTPKWSDLLDKHGKPIRIWTGDNEQHISTDIAYAVLQYWRWTGDDAFLIQYGAEIVLDTAVFWGSRVQQIGDGYELHDQIGPDEYHENVSNSVFVNRMVVWHLEEALALLGWLQQHAPQDAARLIESLDLNADRLARWRDIIARMVIPFDDDKQIHVQFDGFFDLEYIPVQDYEPRVGGIWAYLGHERALRSQVIKQADVAMLMALLGEALASPQVLLNNWSTYYPRCDHGSSLSPAIHAWVAARLGLRDEAYHMFRHALAIDLEDNKGNVADGMHGAACGGVWQAIVFGMCGLHLTPQGPSIRPCLPSHWQRVHFSVVYQGQLYTFTAQH